MEASSGKITRHRLNQGGNRQANHALWRIAMVRLSTDPETRAYAERRRHEGKSRREIIRCLATSPAVHALLNPHPADTSDLRMLRQRAGLTLQTAADELGMPTTLSRIELGTAPTHALLATAPGSIPSKPPLDT